MRKSWTRFLPPISPDYSGACSCLYELDPLIIIHDAAGCTGNYTGYDEPRWYDRPAPVFCSNLRELDAVLGRDDRLIRGIEDCLDAIRPKVILICGSPVPAVIGTDFEGIATEVESLTKIPTIGLATNGAHLYNQGYARCLEALVRRFLRAGPKTEPDGNRVATAELFRDFTLHHVLGNNDFDSIGLSLTIQEFGPGSGSGEIFTGEIDGKLFAAIHGHRLAALTQLIQSQRYDYVLTGHTHRVRDERIGRTRVINPGALGGARRDRRNFCILEIETDDLTHYSAFD